MSKKFLLPLKLPLSGVPPVDFMTWNLDATLVDASGRGIRANQLLVRYQSDNYLLFTSYGIVYEKYAVNVLIYTNSSWKPLEK